MGIQYGAVMGIQYGAVRTTRNSNALHGKPKKCTSNVPCKVPL